MGALVLAQGSTEGVSYEEYQTDALGNRLWMRDNEMIDGVDRTKYQSYLQATGQLTGMELGTAGCGLAGAVHRSCHPSWYLYAFYQSHDPSGNVDATWSEDTRGTDASSAVTVPDESRNYYSAAEQLMYTNRLVGQTTPGEASGGFEEYRYDALGRRVFRRSRRPSGCAFPCEAYVERTVWDGSQVLYEIRSSGGTSVDSSYFELEGGVATGDEPNLYGIVGYAHAEGIDEPLGIVKNIPGTGWAYVTPHANWKGDWSYGTFANGTLCLTTGATCPYWPGFYLSMDRNYTGSTPPSYSVWWGDLIRGSTDNSGLVYQRNRYYDPKTGRFTQVDPIGLAGGLNSYGFGAGDPVSHADPLGLVDCDRDHPDTCTLRDYWNNFKAGWSAAWTPGYGRDTGEGFGSGLALGLIAQMFGVAAPTGGGGASAGASGSVPDDFIVVRGGTSPVPPSGEVFDGAAGQTLEEAASGVPHGTIRSTTAGEIRAGGGSVESRPEPSRSGTMNNKHVNICLGSGRCPFGEPFPNPVPKVNRII